MTRPRLAGLLAQALGGAALIAGMALANTASPAYRGDFGTLPAVAAANPAATALTAAAHGCLTREAWTAEHGTQLPPHLLMTRSAQTRVTDVPTGWALARTDWTTAGWCPR